MRLREGIVLVAVLVVAAGLIGASSSGRRFDLVPGPLLESAQFLFKVDTETGRVWWTVVGPSKTSGKMFVSSWNPIPESQEEAASMGSSAQSPGTDGEETGKSSPPPNEP